MWNAPCTSRSAGRILDYTPTLALPHQGGGNFFFISEGRNTIYGQAFNQFSIDLEEL